MTVSPARRRGRLARVSTPALWASCLAMTLVYNNNGLVNVALPTIGRRLGADVVALQWVVNAYALALSALMLTAGALSDRFGARRVVLAGTAVFAAGSAAAAAAPSIGALIAAQGATGLGAALLVPAALSMLTHAYPDPRERGHAIGVWAAVTAVAFAAGPIVGGLLIELAGWRAVFAVALPFALALSVLCRRVPETPTRRGAGLDLSGQALAVVALAALTVGIVESGALGWGSTLATGALALAVLAGALFLVVERRGTSPMLPLRLFAAPGYAAGLAAGVLLSFAMYGELFLVSLYLQDERGLSATAMGLAFLPQPIAGALLGLVAGRLMARFGSGPVLSFGGLCGLAGALLLTTLGTSTSYVRLVAAFVLFGFSFGAVVPAMTSAAVSAVRGAEVGVASSTLNAARQAGGALGIATAGALLAGADFLAGASLAMVLTAAAMAGIVLMGLLMHGRLRAAGAH